MYKKAFLGAILGVTLLGSAVAASAQTFVYPVGVVSSPAVSCVSFTAYQALGSSDAATGGQVTQLQQLLNREGYLSGVSGYFDNGTFGAVINYQRAHGIQATGTVGPITSNLLSQDSCNGSYGNYGNQYGYVAPVVPSYNCSWNNGYNSNSWYNNSCNGYNSVTLNSLTTSYTNAGITMTIKGSGFTATGNTVRFGSSTITNATSYNGTTLTFTIPNGYYTGTYSVVVTNASGISSNTLSYIMSGNNYNNNSYYNGYSNVAPTVSNISGSTNVSANTTNTWTVTTNDQNNQNVTVTTSWGDSTSNDVQTSYGNGQRTLSLSHVYQYPGTYAIRVTATDPSGLSSYSSMTVTVYGNGYYNNNSYNNGYNNGYNYQYNNTNNGYSYSYSY